MSSRWLLFLLGSGWCPVAPTSTAPGRAAVVLGASLHPPTSAHAYTELRIQRRTVPAGTRWFCLRVNTTEESAQQPEVTWFLASGSSAKTSLTGSDEGPAYVPAQGEQMFTFRPLKHSSPIKAPRAQAHVVLEAWSGRGGDLPDSSSARLLGASNTMTFTFDDRGWSSSLKLVNFTFTELGPGRVTISAEADNATAWELARTVTWYGVVPAAGGGGAFTEDALQSAVIHSVRNIQGASPALNRSYSRPGVYYLECFGMWNGEMDWGDGGWQPNTQVGVKTDTKFPLDQSGKFVPVAIVIPWENGSRPALPEGFTGPVHIGQPIPGDFRAALSVEHVTIFSGGSLHLPLSDAATGHILPIVGPAFVELDVPRGLALLNNTQELCFPHDCHINVVHELGSSSVAGGGAVPPGYHRLRVSRPDAQWSWLNQAIKFQFQVTEPSLYGRSFPFARVRVYTRDTDRKRADNWQPLAMTVVELKPVARLPQRLRTDFGWSYLNDLPTSDAPTSSSGGRGRMSAVKTWRQLGFNTVPFLGASNYVPKIFGGFPGWPANAYDPGELLTPAQRAADPDWRGLRVELHLSPFMSGGFTQHPFGMGCFTALTQPPEIADSAADPPLGFNFSAHGFTPSEERRERTKWRQALLFYNATKFRFGRGRIDLSYDGLFFQLDLKAALGIINYTKPEYLRMDIESFEHVLEDWVDVGFESANFAPRKLPGESDGEASVRMAQAWIGDLVAAARELVPGLVPDLYDVSALGGQGYQVNNWHAIATLGGPPVASPSDYYRVNLLDRLAASVRNERRAILASESPRAHVRPTISPGETPGVDGLPIYLGSPHVTPYLALKNQLLQIYAAGATGFAYYTQSGMYDMGLWLAMRDVFDVISDPGIESIILDGSPVADGTVFNSSEHAVVNAMMGRFSMLIASSSMPPGEAITACVRTRSSATVKQQDWKLCDLVTNETVPTTTTGVALNGSRNGTASVCWSSAAELGRLLLLTRHSCTRSSGDNEPIM